MWSCSRPLFYLSRRHSGDQLHFDFDCLVFVCLFVFLSFFKKFMMPFFIAMLIVTASLFGGVRIFFFYTIRLGQHIVEWYYYTFNTPFSKTDETSIFPPSFEISYYIYRHSSPYTYSNKIWENKTIEWCMQPLGDLVFMFLIFYLFSFKLNEFRSFPRHSWDPLHHPTSPHPTPPSEIRLPR